MAVGAAPPKYPSRTRQTVWPYCEMWLLGSSAAIGPAERTKKIATSASVRAVLKLLLLASAVPGDVFCRRRSRALAEEVATVDLVIDIPHGCRAAWRAARMPQPAPNVQLQV